MIKLAVPSVVLYCAFILGCLVSSNSTADPVEGVYTRPQNTEILTPSDIKSDIWEGWISPRRKLVWSPTEINISESDSQVALFGPSLKQLHRSAVTRVLELEAGKEERTVRQVKTVAIISILSVVGAIATFEIRFAGWVDGGTPNNEAWWLSLDLSKTGSVKPFDPIQIENVDCENAVTLFDVFTEDEIFNALRNSTDVQNWILKHRKGSPPSSIAEMFKNKGEYDGTPRLATDDPNLWLTPYSLERFVFKGLEGDRLFVMIPLTYFAMTRSYEVSYIELSFPIPKKLSQEVREAASLKNGFLFESAEIISKGRVTRFEYSTP